MKSTRRRFIALHLGAGASLVFLPACTKSPAARALGLAELATLTAAAEALVPETETPGAEAGWARDFISKRLAARPELAPAYVACARALEASAKQRSGSSFAAQRVSDREATIRSLCPSVSLAPDQHLSAEQLELRRPLRDITFAFFCSDHLGIDDASYQPPVAPRDPSKPSPVGYSLGGEQPDDYIARRGARCNGVGDYNRAWAAAGFPSPPGVCKSAEEITQAVKLGG